MKKALLFWIALLSPLLADDIQFKVDPNQVSPLASKTFPLKEAEGFGGAAPGFDKDFATTTSDWTFRNANLGGRAIYAPEVDFSKDYPVKNLSMETQVSPLGSQKAPFSTSTVADLPTQASVPQFDHLFDDKMYRGREEDLIRQAIDQLTAQSDTALAKQIKPDSTNGPTLTVDQVKTLINKDVAPIKGMP